MKKIIVFLVLISMTFLLFGCKSDQEKSKEEALQKSKEILGVEQPVKKAGKYGEQKQ